MYFANHLSAHTTTTRARTQNAHMRARDVHAARFKNYNVFHSIVPSSVLDVPRAKYEQPTRISLPVIMKRPLPIHTSRWEVIPLTYERI